MRTSGNPPRHLRDRVLLISGLVAYTLCFQWIYVNYLYRLFGDGDYAYHPPGIGYMIFAWTLSLLPGIWMPLTLTRPSQLAYWILYIIIIIPSVFISFYIGLNRPEEIAGLLIVLFLGFLVTGSSYLLPLLPIRPPHVSRRLLWGGLACITLGLMLWVVIIFRGRLQLVSFANAYDLRFSANDVTRGSFGDYPLMILSGAISPFLMGWGLYRRRPAPVIAGMLVQLLVYSAYATKASLTSIIFISGIYLLLRKNRVPFALKLVWSTVLLLVLLCLSYVLVGETPTPLHSLVLFFVFARIFSINGLMTGQWYYFFQHHPLTYYSTVRIAKWFVPPYPYTDPLGNEIGYYYAGNPDYGATTHFWATDGLAALWLPGILLISVLCALVFWLLDSVSRRHDPRLAALIISYAAAWNLPNNGLFTTLISGGLALLILILYVLPGEEDKRPSTSALRIAAS